MPSPPCLLLTLTLCDTLAGRTSALPVTLRGGKVRQKFRNVQVVGYVLTNITEKVENN